MSSSTPKYALPYPVAADSISNEPVTIKALADRMDLLLGESGQFTKAVTANTAASQVITLARTYPGNATAGAPPGIVIIHAETSVGSGVTVFYWITAWTGTAATVTGFTINLISSTTTNRVVSWRFLPCL